MAASGRNASLLILIFHRVLRQPDALLPNEPDAAAFAALMDLVASGFNPLPLPEAVDRLRRSSLPSRALCVTFDDGYANNLEVAQPILAARRIPATVFVAPGYLDGGRMFNDTVIEAIRRAPAEIDLSREGFGTLRLDDSAARVRAYSDIIARLKYLPPDERRAHSDRIAERIGAPLPADLMLTSEQVRRVHASGIEIGAHTVTHPILRSVDTDAARREIEDSRQALQDLISAPVRSFAYPNGAPTKDYDARHVAMVREAGFQLALSTAWGAAGPGSDAFQLPRIAPWDRAPLLYGARMLRAYRERNATIA